jgi:uncharacterized protein YhaN
LRAVADLLFGVPAKSNDDHIHPYQALRIRALLENAKGEQLLIQRLKRNKDSLRDAHDAPLDEALLKRMVGSVDRAMFERVFGLDHERLRDAGRTLLEGGGDVGESLFDAGAGGHGVRRVLARLREESERLFKPRGGKQEIALLLEKYKLARERVRDAAHPPEAYAEQQRELERRGQERESLARQLSELRQEREHRRVVQATLTSIAQRERVLAALQQLGNLPELPPNFSERRERVQTALQRHRANVERAESELRRLAQRRAELNPPLSLIAVGEETMTLLREGIGSTKKALLDLPTREHALVERRAEVQAAERRLGLGGQGEGSNAAEALSTAEALRSRRADEVRFRKLLAERGAIAERQRAASERLQQLELDFEIQTQRLAALPKASDVHALERAVRLARQVGDIEAALDEVRRGRAELDLLSQAELAVLGPFDGSLAELCVLRTPAGETVMGFEQAFARIDERSKSVATELERQRARAAELASELAAEERVGAVPTEAELERARRTRDERFDRLCESSPEAESHGFSSSVAGRLREYRDSVVAADMLADRLRREAARIAENARRTSEHARSVDEQLRLSRVQVELRDEAEALERAWATHWTNASLASIRPAEARAWLARREHAIGLVVRTAALSAREAALTAQAAELASALSVALGSEISATLAVEVARAIDKLDRERELARERDALERHIAELEVRQLAARRAFGERQRDAEQHESELRHAIAALGFDAKVPPEEVETRLEALSELFQARDQARELERRIAGMRRDIAAFESDVRTLVLAHAPDLAELPLGRAASELASRFERGRRDAEALEHVMAEMAERQGQLEEHVALLARAEDEFRALMTAAGASDVGELPSIESKTRRARELRAELDGVEATLSATASSYGGLPALLEQASATNPAGIAARLQELDELMEQVQEQLNESIRAQQRLEAGLEIFSDTSAAEAATEERALAAALVTRAERWSKLKLAELLLAREVERYRQENQGPVLRRAAELFVRLTQEQYRGLRVGREERSLVAVRANDVEVTVEGLNEAARYHLYLALRLASMERYLEHAEPLPLVLDDILIHFDEDGARAALCVLGDLAANVQVLLFTHHQHNLDLAQRAVADRLFVHEL